jgi:hypothetical protein
MSKTKGAESVSAAPSPTDLAIAAIPDCVFVTNVSSIEDWLRLRASDVTASTAAALFGDGVHSYMTALELWADKSGLRPPVKQNPAMRRGQLMEPVILQMLREDYPDWRFEQANRYYSDPLNRIGATPDFYAWRPDRPGFGVIDAKSIGKFAFKKGWQDENKEIAVPLWIAIQVSITATLAGASWGAVAPLQMGDGGLDLSLEDVPLRPTVWPRLVELVKEFWKRVKEGRPYPPDWGRDAGLVASLYEPDASGYSIDLGDDPEIIATLNSREECKIHEALGAAATKQRKLYDALLIHRLGNARAGMTKDGRVVEVSIVKRGAYSVAPTQYPQLKVKGVASVASASGPF